MIKLNSIYLNNKYYRFKRHVTQHNRFMKGKKRKSSERMYRNDEILMLTIGQP